MKLSHLLFIVAVAVGISATSVQAATTIQLSEPYSGGIPNNFANAAGVATNGMRWGIIVDTSGNGFASSGTAYNAYTAGVTTAGFLTSSGGLTDDYYVPGSLTVDASIFTGADGGSTAGAGSIMDNIVVDYTNGMSAGDRFAIIWFDSNSGATGAKYGFFTDSSFVIPADAGTAVPFSSIFAGNDSIRSASNTFQAVPEPSKFLAFSFGMLGLMLRRRRK